MKKRRDKAEKSRHWRVLLFALLLWAALPGPDGPPGYPQHEEVLDPFHWNWKNLLVNGGFEEAGLDLIPTGWVAGYQKEDSRIRSLPNTPAAPLRLEITSPCRTMSGSPRGRVKPNTNYRLSGWVLTRSVGPAADGANFSSLHQVFIIHRILPGIPSGSIRRSTSALTPGRRK